MKFLLAPLALLCAASFTGCESTETMRTAVQRRFNPEYKTHDVAADARAAYDAAKAAVVDINFKQTKGGPAQGFLDAMSQVDPSGPNGVARQTTLRVKIGVSTRVPNGTEVSVLFSTVEDSPLSNQQGMATEVPLRESPLYGVFFSYFDRHLERAKATASN